MKKHLAVKKRKKEKSDLFFETLIKNWNKMDF